MIFIFPLLEYADIKVYSDYLLKSSITKKLYYETCMSERENVLEFSLTFSCGIAGFLSAWISINSVEHFIMIYSVSTVGEMTRKSSEIIHIFIILQA